MGQLTTFISVFVTKDEKVLSAISRYARASLLMIFIRRRHRDLRLDADGLEELFRHEVLTRDEVDKLKAIPGNHAECIWSWTASIIAQLHREGLIDSDHLFGYLLERVGRGRSGAALICAQLGTRLPIKYVQIIGMIILIHNCVLAFTMGRLG